MAAFTNKQVWYVGSTKYSSVTQWAALTVYTAGTIRRQLTAPTTGYERCFICTIGGTSGSSEPAWSAASIGRGVITTDGTVSWQEITGNAAFNGDIGNTFNWVASKANSATPSVGTVIKDAAGTHVFICRTSGAMGGSEPSWNTTLVGNTTTDSGATWTYVGLASSFTAYGAPHATLYPIAAQNASFSLNYDTVYVSNNHAEDITSSNGARYDALPVGTKIVCVSDTAVPPTAAATTGSYKVYANGLGFGDFACIGIGGDKVYVYGLTCTFGAGYGGYAGSSGGGARFESCVFAHTSGLSISVGGTGAGINEFINCTFKYGAATSVGITAGSGSNIFRCSGNALFGGSFIPTAAFGSASDGRVTGSAGFINVMDADLSNVTSFIAAQTWAGDFILANCKLASAVGMVSGSNPRRGGALRVHNCDNAATDYRYYYYFDGGTVQQETTCVRAGGATNGTTQMSWNMATPSNTSFYAPFFSEDIAQWSNFSSGSHSATVYLTSNTALDNSQFWLELEYPSSSSNPLGATVSSKVATMGTPTGLTVDSVSTWGGSALTYKYSITVNFTPGMVGPVKARLTLANPSTTVYVDPVIYLS